MTTYAELNAHFRRCIETEDRWKKDLLKAAVDLLDALRPELFPEDGKVPDVALKWRGGREETVPVLELRQALPEEGLPAPLSRHNLNETIDDRVLKFSIWLVLDYSRGQERVAVPCSVRFVDHAPAYVVEYEPEGENPSLPLDQAAARVLSSLGDWFDIDPYAGKSSPSIGFVRLS